jgi:exodeoxyribonuclease V
MTTKYSPRHEDFAVTIRALPKTAETHTTKARITFSPDQEAAVHQVVAAAKEEDIVSLGGFAGTGKSTLIPFIADALGDIGSTAFCCFTGVATSVLKGKLAAYGINEDDVGHVGTIHSLMYQPIMDGIGVLTGFSKRGSLYPIKRIFVDEASMVGARILDDLMSYGLPIILVGDHGQLEPIQDRSVMEQPDIVLEKIHRQAESSPILRLSQEIRQKGNIPRDFITGRNVRWASGPNGDVVQFISASEFGAVAKEAHTRLGRDFGILVHSNETRTGLNRKVFGGNVPRVGDYLICLKNNPPLYNGMRGVVETVEDAGDYHLKMCVAFPDAEFSVTSLFNKMQFNRTQTYGTMYDLQQDGYPRRFDSPGLVFDFGLALTVHKAQGSSFSEVIFNVAHPFASREPDAYRRWLYTGVTRASKRLHILGA